MSRNESTRACREVRWEVNHFATGYEWCSNPLRSGSFVQLHTVIGPLSRASVTSHHSLDLSTNYLILYEVWMVQEEIGVVLQLWTRVYFHRPFERIESAWIFT
jgi:hypothetical protein